MIIFDNLLRIDFSPFYLENSGLRIAIVNYFLAVYFLYVKIRRTRLF
ncbi:hypothetical protein QE431_004092 [Flavobacterium sp. SORGH_AS 622]|nr:hypothetical protein [Flavobacterium sp. SORGH_AS_0622]